MTGGIAGLILQSDAVENLTNKLKDAKKAAEEYTKVQQELEDLERSMIVPRAEANKRITEARLASQDETKSAKERMTLLKESLRLEAETANNELAHQQRVIDNLIKINEKKKEANQFRGEDDKKLQDAYAHQIELQTESMARSRRAISALRSAENEEITKEIALTGDLTEMWIKLEGQIDAANRLGFTGRASQLRTEQLAVEKLQNAYNDFQGSLDRFDNSRQGTGSNTFTSGTEAENLQRALDFKGTDVDAFIPIDVLQEEQKNLEGVNKDLKEINDNLPYMRDNTDEVTDGLKAMANEAKESSKNLSQLFSALQDLLNGAFTLFSSINDANLNNAQMALDAEDAVIDGIKSRLNDEKKLKDQGSANDYDRLVGQLAKEQKVRDDQQKKYELYQKRQAQLKFIETQANLGLSVSEAFVEGNKTGPYGFIIAIAAAAATIAAFINMQNQIKSIGKYAEGTEYLQRGNNPKGKDTIPVLANEGERIVPTDINSRLDGIDNDRLPEIYRFYKYNMLKGSGAVQTSATSEVVRELKRGRNISEKMLNHFEDTPTAILLSDGRIMLKYGKLKTQIVTVSKA
jgi:cyclophilin family peptidyl-prolyl cis-trans isomerase